MLDGGVLGRQPEGVPTHRVQHVVALETPVPCCDVANGEGLGVAHVQITGGVGEHVQQVAAFPGPVVHDLERVVLLPVGGPLLLGRNGVVSPSRGLSRIAHNQYLQVTACPPAHTWPRLYRKGRHPVTCVYTGGQYPPRKHGTGLTILAPPCSIGHPHPSGSRRDHSGARARCGNAE